MKIAVDQEESVDVGQVQQVFCNKKHMAVSLSKRFHQAWSYLTYYIGFSSWFQYTPADTNINIRAHIYK